MEVSAKHTPVRPVRRIPLGQALIRVGVTGLAVALLVFGGLLLQLSLGQDPALASKAGGGTVPPAPQTVAAATPPSTTQVSAPPPTPVQTSVS